jgi:integrase
MLLALCNRVEELAMQDQVNATPAPKRVPWNKGKLTGAKPPLRPKHVWSIRTKLQIEGRARDLAMFNLAIDSKLRGCDVVAIRVEDVAAGGYTADRATVRQKKTGRPVRFELSEQTRQAVDDYLKATGKSRSRSQHDNAPICPARVGVDRKCRAGPKAVRHAFTTPQSRRERRSRLLGQRSRTAKIQPQIAAQTWCPLSASYFADEASWKISK